MTFRPCLHGNKNFSKKYGYNTFLHSWPRNFMQKIRENWWMVPEIAGSCRKFWPFDPSYTQIRIFRILTLMSVYTLPLSPTLYKKLKKSDERYQFRPKFDLLTLFPWKQKLFKNIRLLHFSLFITLQLHAKNQRKLMNGSRDNWVT